MNSDNIDSQTSLANSQLSQIIPPEIKDDEFYNIILNLASTANIKTVLEIGSSSGEGSTEAFVTGLRNNSNRPTLFCMELSKVRFYALQKRYISDSFVKPYNVSSVNLEQFPKENEIIEFYNTTSTALNNYPLEEVIRWLYQDIEYVKSSGVPSNGIRIIKEENQIDYFDFVLIDGSEFTGSSELNEVYGAKYIALDDTNIFKNYQNRQKLIVDPNYTLIAENSSVRNGYAIFKKNECIPSNNNVILPVHFFTIVLNGVPFIHYHIEVFKQLSFKWHWHIVEGVAKLNHDTAWSLSLGGKITEEIHRNGRSNDGTSEYLNELKRQYPDNITIYRKPQGIFWDGKREMVNAPLPNINEECLLWQMDVDELWTKEQICITRQMFIDHPTKTAAWYWCWYFVGENLVISTRNCYAHNPKQEWLRTWRFKPGMNWQKHEPPCLGELGGDGEWHDVAAVNPFRHEETEKQGLVFQHFAYVMNKQLQFKETYYGYKGAVLQWSQLQKQTQFPVLLREYVGWVHDETMVNTATSMGLLPILSKAADGINWRFKIGSQEVLGKDSERIAISEPRKVQIKDSIKVIVDGVFFQLNHTGIARVWNSLLEEWVISGFAKQVLVLDRAGSAPKINGVQYRTVEAYNYGATDADRQMLQQICDEEGTDIFISTYYTTPLSTPSVFMGYDMIPELIGKNLDNEPMWREKHYGIKHASAYITISENTAYNLAGCFPQISLSAITVAHCGVKTNLYPANSQEISDFQGKYGISKQYFLLVGERSGWCGYKNGILFFKAFAQLAKKHNFEIVCTGGLPTLEDDFWEYTSGVQVHKLYLTDEELRVAYSGAVALVYTSLYEGFGMPVIEAMACGCPVIASKRASIPEVAGTAALYISGFDVSELVNALQEVQKPELRNQLISAGLEQAKNFSWSKMAEIVREALLKATNKSSNDSAIAEEIVAVKQQAKQIIQVSAIVSTYNAAQFLRGCLENLVHQTLYQKGELEIVVIDSASQQNEESIVKEFQAKHPNIIYERTSERETLYASWNRAIKMARGTYITNANTDDIRRPDALEIMANYLDNHLEVSLIYPDQLITNTPNDTWETTKADRRWNWPPFDYNELESRCIIGSQPMWKKSVHEKYGYFRPEFRSAGDYEFWLRIGKTENLARIPEALGLYYENPQGLEHSSSVGQQETQKILEEYGIAQRGIIPKTSIPVPISPSELNALPYRKIGQSTVNIERPLVTVIIPTKDRPEMLVKAIQSVLNQTFTDLEIIVVNDGGVGVLSVISPFNTKGNIVYKEHAHTLDRSAARNTGIRAARGKYIAYLDDDDIYYPNHIETLVKFLKNSEYKIAYADAVMAQQEKENGEYVTVHRSVPYSLDFDHDKILVSNCTPNLCLMHEKSCLDEVGLFDETLSTHEDWDLIIRLSRKFDIAHIKETTCEFTQRNDGTNTSSHNRADFTRTREIIFNQYRQYAEANPAILAAQKDAFIAEAKELAQQVQRIQAQFTQSLDKLKSQLEEKESHLQKTQAEKSHLAAQVETWQRSTQEVQAKLEAAQSEKEWVKSQLNSWKQTAEEMQIELDRSRLKLKQAQSELEGAALNLIK